jgi:peptide/nickel transport system permease protein
MRLLGYISTRMGIAVFTMFTVSLIVFIAMRLLPGGFEMIILGPIQTEEVRALVTQRFGLDRPLPVQFMSWLTAVLQGDFGTSMITQRPVADELLRRAPATIQLALMSVVTALTIGLTLGILSGIGDASRRVKVGARLVGGMGASTPDFVLGTALVYVFSVWALGPTVGGYVPFFEDPLTNLRAMVLPTATLSVFGIALILRTTRDSVLSVMTSGHITTAVARGDPPGHIIRHQVLRNASLPVLTVTTMYLSALIGGAVIVEILFSVPGVGLYTWNSLHNRDYVVTQSAVLIFSGVFVTFNMLVDIAYALLDPRIRAKRA